MPKIGLPWYNKKPGMYVKPCEERFIKEVRYYNVFRGHLKLGSINLKGSGCVFNTDIFNTGVVIHSEDFKMINKKLEELNKCS